MSTEPDLKGPYFADHGAIHRDGERGFLFTVEPAAYADVVANQLNAALALIAERDALRKACEALVEMAQHAPPTKLVQHLDPCIQMAAAALTPETDR